MKQVVYILRLRDRSLYCGITNDYVKRLVRRFGAWRTRQRKARDVWGWLARWNAACAKSWAILSEGSPTKERFARWERSHNRLCRLVESKNGVTPNVTLEQVWKWRRK